MKRLPLIITLTLAAALVGAYLFYTKFSGNSSLEPWDIVPMETILVYEPGNCSTCLDQAKKSPLWQVVQKTSLRAKSIDSLHEVNDLFNTMHVELVSLHATKKDDFDFIFYGTLKNTKSTAFDSLLKKIKYNPHARVTKREFNSIEIQEVNFQNHILSWTAIENVWVASFTPFLIEDAIRTFEGTSKKAFKAKIAAGNSHASTVKTEIGNLYVDLPNFSKWLSVFTTDQLPFMLNNLGNSIVLDAKVEDKSVALNGFSSDNAGQSGSTYSLSVFSQQSPVPLSLKHLISNRTVMLVSYGISNGAKFGESVHSFPDKHRSELNDTLNKIVKDLTIPIDPLYQDIKGEIGISYVDSRDKKLSRILMIQTSSSEKWLSTFNAFAEKLSVDTVFFERYSEYEIRELPIFNFPEKIIWPLVKGFSTSFYTSIGNTILIAEDIEELKKFLEDIDREETWGKSVSQNQFLETTLLEANLSIYINTPRVWNALSSRVRPEWNKFIQENRPLLNSLKMGAIQFSHLNESYYTNLAWTYGPYSIKEQQKVPNEKTITNFVHALYKSFVVESHVKREDEILIQDSSYTVNLVSGDGKVLWQVPIGQPIVGRVHQIDYFKNNKLQYLFATATNLYLIDRLGKPVEHFPLQLKFRDAEHLTVIDYDHRKKYRFLVSSKSGKLWMYDKEGNALDGWRPNAVETGLLVPAQHHRIKGKDYIIAIRTDGVIHLMNRRGELYKKFPLNLEARLSGDYFLEIGNSLANTYFIVVDKEGYKIKFNLDGKIISRETLVKTAIDARFSLVADAERRSYIITRQENKQLSLFDEVGKEILKNDFIGLNPLRVEYYDFGSGTVYYVLSDMHEDLSFVYDSKGNLLTSPPLESDWIAVRPHDEGLYVFGTLNKTLTIQRVP